MATLMIGLCVPQSLTATSRMIVAEAHSGRTDGNGGHHDNQNKSGLGNYHYHCGGYPAHLHNNGVCPYSGSGSSTPQTTVSESEKPVIPENISMVFDARYYADFNIDLCEAFGYNEEQLLNHFLTCGMKEGRVASESFDVSAYKENNPDLVNVYGDDTAAYYEHYMNCGHSEGRICHR